MIKNEVTLGSDPEVFLYNPKEGKFYPSSGFIKGTKDQPFVVEELGEGFCTQVDNVMVEFNIPPSASKEDFSENLLKILNHIENNLPEQFVLQIQPSAQFEKEDLDIDENQVLGCSEDFCVYTGENVSVTSLAGTNYRFAGGHIHVGYPERSFEKNEQLVKWMDVYLGVPSVLLDEDLYRKSFYGTPGRYREKIFGIEYRTLSNFWVADPELHKWVYEQTLKAYYAVKNKVPLSKKLEDEVFDIITKNDVVGAASLIEELDIMPSEEIDRLSKLKKKEHVNA